ncbi:hypothetical protein SAMN05444005_101834 [Flavobacterium urocaniciphilum]|uniref:Uncharacterized protein n=1 Tax=Flavobacterium urocaniciphilum TaxID=1299341 RepID=A0A1H8ZPP5_9FLAO|nr:hypothetical protein SAMN05444005_101834 [Flavobacterium urocaniciphilum]
MIVNKYNFFKITYILSFVIIIIGTFLKLFQFNYSSILFKIGLIFTFMYITIGIYEVNNSFKIERSKKILLTPLVSYFLVFLWVYFI